MEPIKQNQATINPYFKDIERFQPITRAEEEALYTSLHSPTSRQKVVEANLKLALKHAHKFSRLNPNLDREELIGEANLGLMMAIDKFDPSRGFRFSTYAEHWILNRLRAHVSSHSSIVKKPHDKFYQSIKANNNGNGDNEKLIPLLNVDVTLDADDEDEINSILKVNNELPCIESALNIEQEARRLLQWCDELSDIERQCISAIYGIRNTKPLTAKELSVVLDTSYSVIVKIKNRSIQKLRKKAEEVNAI
ncbi:sigma-70 family RNA polymerase sigma factor [Vibrio metschnikovii]|nr:sigma-70 family RNA polymerase sigma factor [Vibrio metschnikovii]